LVTLEKKTQSPQGKVEKSDSPEKTNCPKENANTVQIKVLVTQNPRKEGGQ